jgi:hypothetical protein
MSMTKKRQIGNIEKKGFRRVLVTDKRPLRKGFKPGRVKRRSIMASAPAA